MMKRYIYFILCTLAFSTALAAQEKRLVMPEDELITDEYLDTVQVKKKQVLNDYTLVGVQGGFTMSNCFFNPNMKQQFLMNPINVGVTYTRYGKMFGYMANFGFQAGVFFTQEGYSFKEDKEGKYTPTILGATSARLTCVEVPVMAHFHYDFWKMKVIANLGCFAGYRLGIERMGDNVAEEYKNSFMDYDRRFDYGIKGGAGIGLIFDPVEIHLMATYKYSMATIYDPDYMSPYYYRYAYPTNIIFSAGLHFQLTKRVGKTKAQLRREAKEQLGLIKTDKENIEKQ